MAAAMALCTARWPTACDPTRGIFHEMGRNFTENIHVASILPSGKLT
jgi:hypothetical protein